MPKHDSVKTNLQAKSKAAQLRAERLPFLTDDFDASVITHDYFEPELEAVLNQGYAKLSIEPSAVAQSPSDWVAANDTLVNVLDRKLANIELLADPNSLTAFRNNLLQLYLEGANTLEFLKNEYPEIYESIERLRLTRGKFLAVQGATESLTINVVRKEFHAELASAAKGLDDLTLEGIAYSAVCNWLIECPLTPQRR